jgi:hypothetical protein
MELIDAGATPNVEWLQTIVGDRPKTPAEMDAYAQSYLIEARDSFEYFRCMLRPGMITSWWTKTIAAAMQQFYEDLIAGKRPMLAIGSPPQHGKSWAATDLLQGRTLTSRRSTRATPMNSARVQTSTCSV